MMVASLPRILRFTRVPKIAAILSTGQPPQTELAAALLNNVVDGKVPLEDEVAAVFDLGDRVEARQVGDRSALLGERTWGGISVQ